MNNYFLIVILFLVVGTSYAQQGVYPLHIGDRWEYDGTYGNPFRKAAVIDDTLMSNGRTYAIIRYDLYTYRYQRQEGDRIFQFNTNTDTEYLWFNFAALVGDTINSYSSGFNCSDIILEQYTLKTIFNVQRRTWTFSVDHVRELIDDEEWIEVTDSLGITDVSIANGFTTIRGAIINGTQYGIITGIAERSENAGFRYLLNQNYPNPFNPSTQIRFDVFASGVVSLNIYDMLGREIAVLVNGILHPGTYTKTWEASGLPDGVYYYQLRAGAFIETKKMVLLH